MYEIWPSPTLISLKIIGGFALLEAFMQLFMPGKKWIGPITATGFQPVYKVYNTKFFMWETGYWGSIDIMHDRAGYYICWGCLVWVPSIYTSPALYLVNNPVALGTPLAAAITVAGLFCIWSNYDCDRQRQTFRETGGKAPVWGKAPTYIVAKYTTSEGTKKSSLLLTSGWWGLARHFHYLPEIMSSFFWTMPGLFQHPLHYFYVFYLSILLADRAIRDDSRCLSKYGPFWQAPGLAAGGVSLVMRAGDWMCWPL
eukprot:gene5665-6851_t